MASILRARRDAPERAPPADAKTYEAAGRSVGVKIVIVNASTEPELKEAFKRAVEQRVDALLVHVDALFNDQGDESQIVALAAQIGPMNSASLRKCRPRKGRPQTGMTAAMRRSA